LEKYKESFDLFLKVLELDKDDPRFKRFYAETCWKASKVAERIGNKKRSKELKELAKNLVDTHCSSKNIQEKIKKDIGNF